MSKFTDSSELNLDLQKSKHRLSTHLDITSPNYFKQLINYCFNCNTNTNYKKNDDEIQAKINSLRQIIGVNKDVSMHEDVNTHDSNDNANNNNNNLRIRNPIIQQPKKIINEKEIQKEMEAIGAKHLEGDYYTIRADKLEAIAAKCHRSPRLKRIFLG